MLAVLSTVDWVIIAAYGALVVGLGWWHNRKQKTSEDYLLGGRRLPWWAVGVSLIATSFSSVSLIGWTQAGASSGLAWLQFQIGDLIGLLIVLSLFLPYFSNLRLTTAYEFLEVRFGSVAARLASGIFLVTVLARAGILLFAAAVPIAWLTHESITLCVVIVGSAALLYSAVGGLGAVVWTDTLQFLLIVVGVLACFVLIAQDLSGGAGAIFDALFGEKATPLVNFDPDPGTVPTFWSAIFAYGTLTVAVFGTNQQAVQRFLACRDMRASRRAAFLGWGLGAFVTFLTLSLGAAMALWFQAEGRTAGGDSIFADFIALRVPSGLRGVLLAAVLAAAMSSMDSAIHSMSTAAWVDFLRPRNGVASDRRALLTTRCLTVFFGLLAIAAGLYAAEQKEEIIQLLLRWMGFLAGPMLGLFLLGILTRKRVGQASAVAATLVGYGAVYLLNRPFEGLANAKGVAPSSVLGHQGIHHMWTAPVTLCLTISAGLLISGIAATRRPR